MNHNKRDGELVNMRAISNIVEDRDLSKWDKELAVKNVAEAVVRVVGGL